MFYTNAYDQIIQQAGSIQRGDINTAIHDHLLQKAVLTRYADQYQPTRTRAELTGYKSWLINLLAKLVWSPEKKLAQLSRATQ